MERGPNGRYSKEFRDEAVKMVVEGGISAYEASRRLSVADMIELVVTAEQNAGVFVDGDRFEPAVIIVTIVGDHPAAAVDDLVEAGLVVDQIDHFSKSPDRFRDRGLLLNNDRYPAYRAHRSAARDSWIVHRSGRSIWPPVYPDAALPLSHRAASATRKLCSHNSRDC